MVTIQHSKHLPALPLESAMVTAVPPEARSTHLDRGAQHMEWPTVFGARSLAC